MVSSLVFDLLILLSPNIIGGIFGMFCPMKEGTGRPKTKSQPPGWVFGVVWPVLFLLLGVSMLRSKGDRVRFSAHIILIALLNSWVYAAGCRNNYKLGAWIFILLNGITVWLVSTGRTTTDKTLSVPLLAWLLFAHQLNVEIVESGHS